MRKQPQNIEAERSLLGAMILDRNVIEESNIKTDDFILNLHQELHSTMKELQRENKKIDMVTILEENKHLNIEFLDDCTTYGMITSNAKAWESIVKDKSNLRKHINIMQEALDIAYNGESPESQLKLLEDIENGTEDELEHIDTMLQDARDHIEYLQTKKGYEGIETKIKLLDYKLDGLRKQTFNIIAARPAMGKTALALQIANSVAKQDNKVAIFSLEMGKRELCRRLIISESQVHGRLIKDKKLETKEWQLINEATGKLHRRNLYIDDEFSQTITDIYRKCKRQKKKSGLDLVIIDYLQLLKPDGKFNSKNDEVGHNSRILKKISKDLDCPVICLSQLSRSLESRPDKRPVMSDLRDSGNIEQDADTVTMLYRDDVYKDADAAPDYKAEIIVRKNRAGETGTVTTDWNGGKQTFYNI